MKEQDLEKLVRSYEGGTRHPEASGLEHLNLLQVRSRLAELESQLTEAQRKRLVQADRVFYRRAEEFLRAIGVIADLALWRMQEAIPTTHWWWYLDVIVHLPVVATQPAKQEESLEAVPT